MYKNRLMYFLIITFSITDIAWISLAVLTKLCIISFTNPMGTILHIIGGFGPTIAALLLTGEKLTFDSVKKFVFHGKKNSWTCFWILSVMAVATFWISSMEFNSILPWYLIPVVFLQAVFIYGGEEELGWRGTMQPLLEKKYKFSIATSITGVVWGIWHIPLWFVTGSSQQNMNFFLFLIFAVILSFWLAAIYKKTHCVFVCSLFHGLINTLLSVFVVKLNPVLVLGLIAMSAYSIYLWHHENKKERTSSLS